MPSGDVHWERAVHTLIPKQRGDEGPEFTAMNKSNLESATLSDQERNLPRENPEGAFGLLIL